MKVIFLFQFLFCLSLAQTNEVHYNVILIPQENSRLDKMLLGMSKNIYTITEEMLFVLEFNKDRSLYSLEKKMFTDETAAQIARIKINYFGRVEQKHNNVYVEYNDNLVLPESYIVKQNSVEWKITGRKKNIDGLECLQAVFDDIVIRQNKTFNNSVEVWFAPSISYPYGPSIYGGLPGLILEVRTNKYVIVAKRIKLNINNKNEITQLGDYPVITYQEMIDLSKSFYKN